MTVAIGDDVPNPENDLTPKQFAALGKVIIFAISVGAIIWGAATISASVNSLKDQTIILQRSQAEMGGIIQALQINQATINEQIATIRNMIRK